MLCYGKQIELPSSHNDSFDIKIREMRAGQAKNVAMFSDRENYEFVTKLKEFKNPGYRMTPYDCSLLKRFEILRVEKDGEMIERLVTKFEIEIHDIRGVI